MENSDYESGESKIFLLGDKRQKNRKAKEYRNTFFFNGQRDNLSRAVMKD